MGELFGSEEIQVMVERNNQSSKEKMQETNNLNPFEKICQIKENSRKLKLEITSITEIIARTKEEAKVEIAKKTKNLVKLDRLMGEIEEINVEKMFVELSIGDEKRELREIRAKRGIEEAYFNNKFEKIKNEIEKIFKKIERNKEIEAELAMTNNDIFALRNELEFIKSMEISFQENSLKSIRIDLENSKRELASLKEEGFKLMALMDETRNEIQTVKNAEKYKEIVELEKETNKKLQNLNSDLQTTMAEVESFSMAEKRSNAIISNLSSALNQYQIGIDSAKREKEMTDEEIKSIREEIIATNMNKKSQEERLEELSRELEKHKKSEVLALEKLGKIAEHTMKQREILSKHNSTITLSKFEYEYLRKQASLAKEIADKKVEASEAWIEAIKAREKEINLQRFEKPKQAYENDYINENDEERNNCKKELEGMKGIKKGDLNMSRRRRSMNLRKGKIRIRRPSISPERGVKFDCSHPLMAGKRNFVWSVFKSLRGK